ncbi:hypothetical protein ACFVVA_41215 [Kitasatospora sp. NPDC058048]|uniref:hypothetical protein n=1 Tax=Kitasatospora sp. NPDC058048 TaxID=3346313 RepID=UPI0036D82914
MYVLRFTEDAAETLRRLAAGPKADPVKLRKVRKALALLQTDPRYPGLHSHQYEAFPGHAAEKVWDSYVENHNPSAWRIYWMYGPDEKTDQGEPVSVITVLVIGPHL